MKRKFNFSVEGNYFLVTGMPTPNGRIHLGHIAGPYLKMDILKRKVKRNNGVAYLCSGSDVYESYVELKATQLNKSTNEVANHFHELIIKDFKALDIEFDLFVNPLDEDLKNDFCNLHQNLVQNLVNMGHTETREELVPYDPANERYHTGCWITGSCPNCGLTTGSYLCENCGYHYRPQDIFNKDDYPNARLIPCKSLFLKLDKDAVLDNTKKVQKGIYKQAIEKYMELQGPYIRLTTLQQIGVPFEWDQTRGQVIFTYTGLLFYSIFCGYLLQIKYGLDKNPMEKSAKFICCASFGIDNVVPFLAGVHAGGCALTEYRPFDHYFCNFFYNLNGEKFSTSKSHVIWGADIVELSNIQADAVRYFLCKVNPELRQENFETDLFIQTINDDLYKRMNSIIQIAFKSLKPEISYDLDDFMFSLMEGIMYKQNQSAMAENFQLSALVQPIEEWLSNFEEFNKKEKISYSYWWLKMLAYLCYPIMPHFSTILWNKISNKKEISLDSFFSDDTIISKNIEDVLFRKVDYENLSKCLPKAKNTHL